MILVRFWLGDSMLFSIRRARKLRVVTWSGIVNNFGISNFKSSFIHWLTLFWFLEDPLSRVTCSEQAFGHQSWRTLWQLGPPLSLWVAAMLSVSEGPSVHRFYGSHLFKWTEFCLGENRRRMLALFSFEFEVGRRAAVVCTRKRPQHCWTTFARVSARSSCGQGSVLSLCSLIFNYPLELWRGS